MPSPHAPSHAFMCAANRNIGAISRGHLKQRQKSLKSVKNVFDTFQHFFAQSKTLSLLSLFFLEKGRENHQKDKDFLSRPNPLNPWRRREKRLKKQGILHKERKQGIQKKKKERKDRENIKNRQKVGGPLNVCSEPTHLLPVVLRLQSPYTGESTPPSSEIPKKSEKGLPRPPGQECRKSPRTLRTLIFLVDVSDIFYFYLLGEGEGGVRGAEEGIGCFS